MSTHFYAASFSIKLCFMKLAIFFLSSTRHIFRNLLAVSESSRKIQVKLHWTLSLILLTSAVICKQRLWMKARLCNIFKTANAATLTKTLLESPDKVLQSSQKRTIFEQPVQRSILGYF